MSLLSVYLEILLIFWNIILVNEFIFDVNADEDFGFKRLCSALSAHMWPNMEMRTSKQSEDSISHENNVGIAHFLKHYLN